MRFMGPTLRKECVVLRVRECVKKSPCFISRTTGLTPPGFKSITGLTSVLLGPANLSRLSRRLIVAGEASRELPTPTDTHVDAAADTRLLQAAWADDVSWEILSNAERAAGRCCRSHPHRAGSGHPRVRRQTVLRRRRSGRAEEREPQPSGRADARSAAGIGPPAAFGRQAAGEAVGRRLPPLHDLPVGHASRSRRARPRPLRVRLLLQSRLLRGSLALRILERRRGSLGAGGPSVRRRLATTVQDRPRCARRAARSLSGCCRRMDPMSRW